MLAIPHGTGTEVLPPPHKKCRHRAGTEAPPPPSLSSACQRTGALPIPFRLPPPQATRKRNKALHLFSGPQRHGCVSDQLRKKGWSCIDVDKDVWGTELDGGNNLSNDMLWLEIMGLVARGKIQGVHMGPPCSTCSHSPGNPPEYPRPVRSAALPLGLPKAELRASESRGVSSANYRYFQCISLGSLCQAHGISFAIEFPSKLGDDHVTLADFPTAIELLAKDGVRLINLHPGRFSSWAAKPTSLICWGAGWGTEATCSAAITGKFENRTNEKWKTTSLAAYSATFCKYIANSIAEPSAAASSAPTSSGLLVPDQGPDAAAANGVVVPDYTSETN